MASCCGVPASNAQPTQNGPTRPRHFSTRSGCGKGESRVVYISAGRGQEGHPVRKNFAQKPLIST